MILYMVALLAQLAQSFCYLFRGDDKPTGAFQTGGTIGNIVGCCIMLIVGGRALWLFHNTGGLHYDHPENDPNEPLLSEEDKKGGKNDDDDDGDDDADPELPATKSPPTKGKKNK